MSENLAKNTHFSVEKQGFTDTGSTVFDFSSLNSEQFSPNLIEIDPNCPNPLENQGKTEENQAFSHENQPFSAKNQAEEANTKNFDENSPQNASNSTNPLADSENFTENTANSTESKEETAKEQENNAKTGKISPIFSKDSVSDFKAQFPAVDVEALSKSETFQAFLSALNPNPTLSTVYAHFNRLTASIEENVSKKLLQRLANNASSVGSLASKSPNDAPYFTKEQVKSMSPEQIKHNYEKIRQSQTKWH